MGTDGWEPLAAKFDDQYGTLYGQVRTHVIHEQLRLHLPGPPAAIVDVGGGSGHQAVALARDGYDVTVVDPSDAMLERAAVLVAGEPSEVRQRIRLVKDEGERAPALLGEARFAGVCCHGVVPYLEDPRPLVRSLGLLAAQGATVSIVAKNRRTLAVRPAVERDWVAALAAFDAGRQVNGLGVETRGDTPEAMGTLLDVMGVQPVDWYGVRCFTEGWSRERGRVQTDDAVLAVELEASRRDPYRQLSRLFHIVGVRR